MKILAVDGISQGGISILEGSNFEVQVTKVAQEQLENYINEEGIDAVIVKPTTEITQELIDGCPSLKLIGTTSVTMDHIDVQYAIDQGLQIANTPDATANSIAELVFAHILGLTRNLHLSNREMPLEGDMNFNGLKKLYQGQELRGKTLGIIGTESSGIATAKIAIGLGMNVLFFDYEATDAHVELEFFDGQTLRFDFNTVGFDEVIQDSDFISVHDSSQENCILGSTEFEKMKNGVGIINCTKSGLVDEIALVKSIEKGNVRYAALDVFENQPRPEIQLLMNPNLSLSPNLGSGTLEAQDKTSIELANQIVQLLS